MPTPTTADQATLLHIAAGDVLSDYADLLELMVQYDPKQRLRNKIEGPVRKALVVAHAKLLDARLQIQEAMLMAYTELKIPKEDQYDWRDGTD